MISLVNSKGENIDDIIEVTKVEEYKGNLLTRAGSTNNGLRKVFIQLKEYNEKTFEAKTQKDGKKVMFPFKLIIL